MRPAALACLKTTAPAQLTGLNSPSGTDTSAHLRWDPSSEPDLDHYLVRYTAKAAGEFYEHTVAATEAETTLYGLTQGQAYRVVVTAVDTDGYVGPDSEPIGGDNRVGF